ncbi:MAG TPA: hypothetical protein VLB86_01045 [Gaiellaceae bacterium]|nr:hypothetical protein [Gaiellaceae bacterium]
MASAAARRASAVMLTFLLGSAAFAASMRLGWILVGKLGDR